MLQIREAHRKPYAIIGDGLHDHFWWRKDVFDQVCSEGLVQNQRRNYPDDVTDNVLNYEVAKPAYIKLQKFEGNDGDDIGVLSGIRLLQSYLTRLTV